MFTYLLILAIPLIVIGSRLSGRNTTTYVVKSWQSAPVPNEKGEFIRISGRQEGIIAWLLSYVGIDPTAHMTVTADNFRLEQRTFWGYSRQTIGLSKIGCLSLFIRSSLRSGRATYYALG